MLWHVLDLTVGTFKELVSLLACAAYVSTYIGQIQQMIKIIIIMKITYYNTYLKNCNTVSSK